jgi:hypothetical protein
LIKYVLNNIVAAILHHVGERSTWIGFGLGKASVSDIVMEMTSGLTTDGMLVVLLAMKSMGQMVDTWVS